MKKAFGLVWRVQSDEQERATGKFGSGERNDRGDLLIEWATANNMKIMNTVYKKKISRRWTWQSPDGSTRNEIDYIMTNRPNIFTDVKVLNRLDAGSDHRAVMGVIRINVRKDRQKCLSNPSKRPSIEQLVIKKDEFQILLKNRFSALELEGEDGVDEMNDRITTTILECASEVAPASKMKDSKLSTETSMFFDYFQNINISMECLLRVGLLAFLCSCATGVSQPSLSGTFLPGTSILYLGCNTPSRNSSALSWFKEDPIDYSLSLFTSNPDLEFQSVAASDAACYYCYLEGDVVDFVCLDVPAQQSGVVELSYTGVFVEGSTFEYFGCSKGGRDASNVQWYAVNPGSNQTFHSQFTLAFTSLAPGDTGYYHCMYNGELVDKVFINVTQAAVPECTGDNTGQVDKVTEAPPKALTRDEIIFIAIGAVLFVLMLLLFIWAVCWCCACVQMKRATGKSE
ncbi:uncharacterized protein LOC106180622 [Lingula anatina]|uniref:Uncharacterized protein LOC106180622 n=1 Tax=Lingula anatina TaxID=7574 RepID=A0A2R2MPD4_LINAN|nr:uncharacterized protein LOC106180622 [Lingula anatina]|eukprot:XP_023932043.1 uncharacterized protein LOC106180622 [Lingula anatina]